MLRIIVILLVIVTSVFGNASTDVVLNCEGIKFVKKGCYRDTSHRTLKKLVFSDRNNIDWHDWNNFLDNLACKCAGRAKESQYRYIGLQYYGECWSGEHSEDLFANKFSEKCIGHDYEPCNETLNIACTGEAEHNYVYEIVYEETETDICEKLSPCVNGECVSTGDSYMCRCVPGYEGQNCEKIIDPDDCAGNPCVNGECSDGVNSYECKCNLGYEGTNCENNVDDCAGSPCVNGECIDGVNSYECKCVPGYEGTNCENNVDDCAGSPCVNGECIDGVNSYECKCVPGYQGRNCETNVDDCAKKPCKHGVCVDKVNAYVCLCKAGYTGRNCDTDIDECARKPCRNDARCINKVNAYQCVCKAGYKGVNCETNINDCVNHQCKNGGVCKDGINSYTCSCPKHYTGSKCEKLNKLNIQLKSLGCDDVPGWWLNRDCSQAIASIKVNGREYAKSKRGYNIVVFNNQGSYRESKVFDTHGSTASVTSMKNYLRNLPDGQIVLVAISNEATDQMNKVNGAYECLREIGAVYPITSQHRSSFTLVGYTGPGRPSFIRQVQKASGRGPSTITVDIPIPYTPSKVTITPNQCINKDWWSSFDKRGWSTCANEKLFITGFYRNQLGTWDKDEINRLEEAKCCSSNSLYLNQRSECKNADWWATLDRPSTWGVCPVGYFLNGLYRSSGNNLHNIEEGKCCKPINHPKSYEHCYHEFIRNEFDKQGWTTCKKTGYYVAGVYRDHYKDWLHDIDYLKCCKMWTGP